MLRLHSKAEEKWAYALFRQKRKKEESYEKSFEKRF